MRNEVEGLRETLRKKLRAYKRKTISLRELEEMLQSVDSYETFAEMILELEQQELLTEVKAQGRTPRTPTLAYSYRINQASLKEDLHSILQRARLDLHPSISIDPYFSMELPVWQNDLRYIVAINNYIKKYGLPDTPVPAPERSFELVGDEKWIFEKEGKELLERLKLWDHMNIMPVSDPLMFAVNPKCMDDAIQDHLIVENKTTYQGLLPVLTETKFSTLIYGCGNKIVRSIEQFESQYPVSATHHFYYFGDLDRSGINIWQSLNKRQKATPAHPFYRACFEKEPAKGKGNQKSYQGSLQEFLTHFSEKEKNLIKELLDKGGYYPQEVLKTKELQMIWRDEGWLKSSFPI